MYSGKATDRFVGFLCAFGLVLSLSADMLSGTYLFGPREKTIKVDSSPKHINTDEIAHAIKNGSVLDYLRARQRLYELNLDELRELRTRSGYEFKMKPLADVVNAIYAEKADLYTFKEGFLPDNIPLSLYLPFYKGEKRIIGKITENAERLYFNNLRLSYKKNNLKKVHGDLWTNPRLASERYYPLTPAVRITRAYGLKDLQITSQESIREWAYTLRPSSRYNISHERLPLKKYSENMIRPVLSGDMFFLKNEHRLFAIDVISGRQKWSVSPDTSGEEFYETPVHMHHNPYGDGMLLSDGRLYTELCGKLVAYSLRRQGKPVLTWERDLGEYTLATSPVSAQGVIVAGLINARGELWLSGFSEREGILKWSTYVGLSAFASPVCNLSAVSDGRLFLGTNHGILICIDALNGKLIWARKYEPKKYSIFQWFSERQFRYKNIEHKGFIAFDSQFVAEDDATKTLAYKPRESDVLYILDSRTGEAIDQIRNDQGSFMIMGMLDSRLIMLDARDRRNPYLVVMRYPSGTTLCRTRINSGKILGISRFGRKGLAFKAGKMLYMLSFEEERTKLRRIACQEEGWLLQYEQDRIFLGSDGNIQSFAISGKGNGFLSGSNDDGREILSDIREVLNGSSRTRRDDKDRMISHLHRDLKDLAVPIQEIIPDILANREALKSGTPRALLLKLRDSYGDEVIEYEDVALRFDGFLWGLGLIDKPDGDIPYASRRRPPQHGFSAVGSSFMSLLPVNVIKGNEPDFFMISHNDMIYCVDEQQNILWARKVACRRPASGIRAADIYLYENVTLINDKINVIAVDSRTGRYLWSATNRGVYDKNVFIKAAKEVEYTLAFMGTDVILAHKNKLSIINIYSGFCSNRFVLDGDKIEKILVLDKKIVMIFSKKNMLKVLSRVLQKRVTYGLYVLNDKLEIQAKIKLGNKKSWSDNIDSCLFAKKAIIMFHSGIYVYDISRGILQGPYNFNVRGEAYLAQVRRHLILIEPFRRMIGLKTDGIPLAVQWSIDLGLHVADPVLKEDLETSFAVDDTGIVAFAGENNHYSLSSINVESGKKNWESQLGFIKGEFADMYNIHSVGNYIYCMLYTAFRHSDQMMQKECMRREEFAFDVYPVLVKLDKTTGKVVNTKEFPPIVSFGYSRGVIAHTRNLALFTVNGNNLYAERR